MSRIRLSNTSEPSEDLRGMRLRHADLTSPTRRTVDLSGADKRDDSVTSLKTKLKASEKLVAELQAENQEIKKEVKLLAQELEELHDTFREDQVSEFRHMKRELEANAKNIRVLQFKLKKTERMNEQLEIDKNNLEKKLNALTETSKLSHDKKSIKDLENELKIAKEVSLKLHAEVEELKKDKKRLEGEVMKINRSRSQTDDHKTSSGSGYSSLSNVTKMGEKEQEELVKSLYDTIEREKDLQEQLKFAEEENRTIRRKLATLEQENEIFMMQIKKMANKNAIKGASKENSSKTDSEELNSDEMKLHLDLYEQEVSVLRKKTDELQQENENLQHEVKYLQEKLVSQPMTKIEMPQIPSGSPSNVIYEHKIRILETEAKELRLKLVDREKENESLRTELDVHRRKASKVMVRSRSLENETNVDLKRQLQLVEQEASILRQKIISLESENDKLSTENKKLQIRVSRRPPPSPLDELQIENLGLKEKIEQLERRRDSGSSIQLSSNLASFVSSSEKDVINGLKLQIKNMEEEKVQISRRVTELELELSKVSLDNRKLRECLNYKKTPMRVVKESATRLELKEIIHQMEEEISKLQATLNAKDMHNETLKENLSEAKKALDIARTELRGKQSNEQIIQEYNEAKVKIKQLKSQLELVSKESSWDLAIKLQSLEAERNILLNKVAALEKESSSKRDTVKELQEQLESTYKEQKQLQQKVRGLETEKLKIQNEAGDLQEKLLEKDKSLNEIKRELEDKTWNFENMKNEKEILQKGLEEERKNSSFTVSLKPKVSSSNHEGLIKQISDLENRNSSLQRSYSESIKEHKQKETSLRKEYEKQVQTLQDEQKSTQKLLSSISDENKTLKSKLTALNQQVEKLSSDLKESNEKYKNAVSQNRKEKDDFLSKINDLEIQLRAEQRRKDKTERENEMIVKTKDESLLQARERIFRLEREMKRMEILVDQEKRDHGIVVTNYEREITKLRQEYEDLTSRYEMLEQEFVTLKAKSLKEGEDLNDQMNSLRRSLEEKGIELQKFKQSFSAKQEEWINEKVDLQEKLSQYEVRMRRGFETDLDRNKLRTALLEKDKKLEEYVLSEKELRKEVEKLKENCQTLKLQNSEDSGRGSSETKSGSDSFTKEVQYMKNKINHAETSHRGEVAALRAEYESRMKEMRDEITILLTERDHFRARIHLNSMNSSHKDEMEDIRAAMETLRAHLEQALLDNRNLKIEHASERSSWQIQVAELKTRLNQADEQSLMEISRGSARNYIKTRLELAWEKERQEHQKLMSDTQKLVEEMKTRVISLEIAREKERSEARKQLQEMKVMMDKEQEDTQKRIGELQLDLIDLRDSHARIRSQNDRLKRERLALEKEREEFRIRVFAIISIENKVHDLSDQINQIIKIIPESPNEENNKDDSTASTSLEGTSNEQAKRIRRTRTRPLSEVPEMNMKELRKILEELKVKVDEICRILTGKDGDDHFHRSISFRRAISSSDIVPNPRLALTLRERALRDTVIRVPPRPKAMAKKSLSLDHNMTRNSSSEQIWDSGDESIQTTPGSSISNLRCTQTIYGYGRGGHSSISGYESDSSWRWTRESSYGSDVSAPAVITGSSDHHRHHGGSSSSRPKKSIFRLLKKPHSIENTASDHDGDKSKDREKKERSLRSRISRTLWKTLSPSSTNLHKESKDEKHQQDHPSSSKQTFSRLDNQSTSGLRRTLSPTRAKPPHVPEVPSSSNPGEPSGRSDFGNVRQNLRSVSRSTRV